MVVWEMCGGCCWVKVCGWLKEFLVESLWRVEGVVRWDFVGGRVGCWVRVCGLLRGVDRWGFVEGGGGCWVRVCGVVKKVARWGFVDGMEWVVGWEFVGGGGICWVRVCGCGRSLGYKRDLMRGDVWEVSVVLCGWGCVCEHLLTSQTSYLPQLVREVQDGTSSAILHINQTKPNNMVSSTNT